jgi:hypothetical protein
VAQQSAASRIALYIDPPTRHFDDDALFDADSPRLNGDRILAPYAHLRDWFAARNIPVHTADRLLAAPEGPVRNFYVSMGSQEHAAQLARRADVTCSAFFALECPIVEPSLYRRLPRMQKLFKRIFCFTEARCLERFLTAPLECRLFRIPQSFDAVHEDLWRREDRGFLVMINANKLPRVYWRELYTERLKAVEYFSGSGDLDLYGVGWDRPSLRVGKTRVPWTLRRIEERLERAWQRLRPDPSLAAARRAWRGPARSKAETMSRYRFALCYENMILEGWITEKIFDCFFAGTIPVYWGAPDIGEHVPAECFIDRRRFSDDSELKAFLKSLGEREVRAYRENARDYVASPRFDPFRKQAFVDLIARIVAEDAGIAL